jgi:hypothetical protein
VQAVLINGYGVRLDSTAVLIDPAPEPPPPPEPALRLPLYVQPVELEAWIRAVTDRLNGDAGRSIPPVPTNIQPPELAVWAATVYYWLNTL